MKAMMNLMLANLFMTSSSTNEASTANPSLYDCKIQGITDYITAKNIYLSYFGFIF